MFLDENMDECEYALKTATQGGLAAAAEDMYLGFEDWSSDVEAFEGNISILHG